MEFFRCGYFGANYAVEKECIEDIMNYAFEEAKKWWWNESEQSYEDWLNGYECYFTPEKNGKVTFHWSIKYIDRDYYNNRIYKKQKGIISYKKIVV